MKLRLIVEIDASHPKDANYLAGVISDYADDQFEVVSMDRGRSMRLRSWIIKPDKEGFFK